MKIAITGAGKLGSRIVDVLLGSGNDITVIDESETALKKLTAKHDIETALGNAKELGLLESVGVGRFDLLIATTNYDETNIVIAALAKKLGCEKVFARVINPEYVGQHEYIKKTFGIDKILNPDFAVSTEIATFLLQKYSFPGGMFSMGSAFILEFNLDDAPELSGKTLRDVQTVFPRTKLVCVSKNGKIIIPSAKNLDACLTGEDDITLYIIGSRETILSLAERLTNKKNQDTDIKTVMIAGGGKTCYYTAKRLGEKGVAVKIIEPNKDRCQYLSTHLENALVLNGDFLDLSFLKEEGISTMDAFISATRFDEDNIMLALVAKEHGVEDVITKVTRDSYASLIPQIGIDMALNPVNITASHLVSVIQNESIASSMTIQGQAEIIEVIATKKMRIVGKTLRDLKLPTDILIVSLTRGDEMILPTGGTKIAAGDRIVAIGLNSETADLEGLIRKKKLL
jgi:trk system potassium uptake protein TrkA